MAHRAFACVTTATVREVVRLLGLGWSARAGLRSGELDLCRHKPEPNARWPKLERSWVAFASLVSTAVRPAVAPTLVPAKSNSQKSQRGAVEPEGTEEEPSAPGG